MADYGYDDGPESNIYESRRWPATGIEVVGGTTEESYAYALYGFHVPAAAAYKLKFSVLGAPQDGGGPAYLSMWNYRTETDDAGRWTSESYGWSSSATGSRANVQDGQVYTYLTAYGSNYGQYEAAKVKLTFRYGILK